jgi:hypothetical protein
VAVDTGGRHIGDGALDAFGWKQDLEVRRMPGLSAGLLAGRLLSGSGGQRGRRARRRWLEEFAQARLEHGDALFQRGDAGVALTTSWTYRWFHPSMLTAGKPFSCASLSKKG